MKVSSDSILKLKELEISLEDLLEAINDNEDILSTSREIHQNHIQEVYWEIDKFYILLQTSIKNELEDSLMFTLNDITFCPETHNVELEGIYHL